MMNDTPQVVDVINGAKKNIRQSNVIYYIYVLFNLPFAAIFAMGSIKALLLVANAGPMGLNGQGLVFVVTHCITLVITALVVLSCVGVLLRKNWGRWLVIGLCIYNLISSLLVALMHAFVGQALNSVVTMLWMGGSALWLVLFLRARIYFMKDDGLSEYLSRFYEKYKHAEDVVCRCCNNWEGERRRDLHFDAMCGIDMKYYKGDHSCPYFFPYVARNRSL